MRDKVKPSEASKRSKHSRAGLNGAAHPVDVHVGFRMKLRRRLLGLSQERLAATLGLTFQQVQKYERGNNRICASRLFDLSQVLDVPINFFFDGMEEEMTRALPLMSIPAETGPAASRRPDLLERSETIGFVQSYYGIDDSRLRRRFYDFVKAVAGGENDKGAD